MSVFKKWFGKKENSCCDIQFEEVRENEKCCEAEKTADYCEQDKEGQAPCC